MPYSDPEKKKEHNREYKKTEKGRETQSKYRNSVKGKIAIKRTGDKLQLKGLERELKVKEGKKCCEKDCDISDPHLLEFNHIDPKTKKFRVSSMAKYKDERFYEEVKKCELLCIWHHRVKSFNNFVFRENFFNEQKLKREKCNICGIKITKENIFCFDWDHIKRSSKSDGVAHLQKSSKETLLNEINKCQLLCCHCHKLKTLEENKNIRIEKDNEDQLKIEELSKTKHNIYQYIIDFLTSDKIEKNIQYEVSMLLNIVNKYLCENKYPEITFMRMAIHIKETNMFKKEKKSDKIFYTKN